jgi:hypothetical protein
VRHPEPIPFESCKDRRLMPQFERKLTMRPKMPPNAECVECRYTFYAGRGKRYIRCPVCRKGKRGKRAHSASGRNTCPVCHGHKSYKATVCLTCFSGHMSSVLSKLQQAAVRQRQEAERAEILRRIELRKKRFQARAYFLGR